MQPTDLEYRKLLTEAIQKQIIILGPAITLAKVRKIQGITVKDDGAVMAVSGPSEEINKKLVEEFGQVSSFSGYKIKEDLSGANINMDQGKIVAEASAPVAAPMTAGSSVDKIEEEKGVLNLGAAQISVPETAVLNGGINPILNMNSVPEVKNTELNMSN